MHRAAHSSSQVLGGGPPGLITPHCETLWCSLCGRSAGRSDSCASREPPLQDWLYNWQLRGIPCGPISSRVCKPHLMTLPVLRGFGCWGLMRGVWHHQDRRRRGPRELTGIVDHARGGSPHGAGPLPGTERTPSTINSKTPPASSTPSISSSSLATPLTRCVAASSKTRPVTAGAKVTPSIRSAIFCAPRVIGSRSVKRNASVRPSRQMKRISVSKSPTCSPSKSETSSTKPHPPKANAWPLVSSRAYQPVPSPRSLAWAGPYASGRTPSWPTSIPAEQATGQQKPSTESSSWADAPPEATATPPTTDSECSSSQEA